MSKLLSWALLLIAALGFIAAPAMAQDSGELGKISRGGGEETDTKLTKKGITLETDGFKLNIKTRVQFRLTYQNDGANGPDGQNGADFVNFRIRRCKTAFSGYIFQKEFQYKVQLQWTDGSELIEDAWFRWAIMQYINITAGQAKLPWNWEEMASSSRTQFVDRSYVNEVFNQDYAKGITLDGKIGEDVTWLKYWVGVYNGVLKDEDDFRNDDKPIRGDRFADSLVDNEMMVNLRLETHPLGDVKHGVYENRGEDEYSNIIFAIGIGVNWFYSGLPDGSGLRGDTAAGSTASGRSRTSQDTLAFTADGHFRAFGLSVDVAFFWRHTEFHNRGANKFDASGPSVTGAAIGNVTDSGFTFEVAYFILPETFNVGVRFNMLNADDFWQNEQSGTRALALRPDATEMGISVNYFLHGDYLKLTFDILYVNQQLALEADGEGLDGVYNSVPERVLGGGTLGSSGADHNELFIVRLQLQWIF